jgi:hypothetical protein
LEFGRIWNLAKFGSAKDFVGNEKNEKKNSYEKKFLVDCFFFFYLWLNFEADNKIVYFL